jgi:hypothetical protein
MIDPEEDPSYEKKEITVNISLSKFNLCCLAILLLTYPFDDVISSYRSALKVCWIYTNMVMLYVVYKTM